MPSEAKSLPEGTGFSWEATGFSPYIRQHQIVRASDGSNMLRTRPEKSPSGAKAPSLCARFGTIKVVPCYKACGRVLVRHSLAPEARMARR
jgi:hypothetical protein